MTVELSSNAVSERTLRIAAGLSGIVGPIALAVYFGAPALTNWAQAESAGTDTE